MNSKRTTLLAFILYAAIASAMTWPLILNLNDMLFGGFGDTHGNVYINWVRTQGLLKNGLNPLLCAPFGVPVSLHNVQPLYEFFQIISTKAFGDIGGQNILVLTSFIFSSLSMYLFLNYLLQDETAAFFGGFLFGFTPAAVFHAAAGHLTFSLNFTLPLLLWSLFFHKRNRSIFSSALVGLSYVSTALLSTYWGFFSIHLLIFFFLYDYITSEKSNRWGTVKSYAPAAFVTALLLGVIFTPVLQAQSMLQDVSYNRPLREVMMLSAFPWDYIFPTIHHPLFGEMIYPLTRQWLHGSNIFEQSLYQGIIPITAVVFGLIYFRKLPHFLFFTIGAIWLVYFSLPFAIPLGEKNIPFTLGYFVYQVAPMFRGLARAGIFVSLFLSGATAVVIHRLKGISPLLRSPLCQGTLFLILLLDFWTGSPDFLQPIKVPQVYNWLSEQQAETEIAIYPMVPADTASFNQLLFWQRVHGKKMVNGVMRNNKPAWEFYERVRDLGNPQTIEELKAAGIDLIIVHPALYREGRIPESLKKYYPNDMASEIYNQGQIPFNPKLGLPYKTFGEDLVFDISISETDKHKKGME